MSFRQSPWSSQAAPNQSINGAPASAIRVQAASRTAVLHVLEASVEVRDWPLAPFFSPLCAAELTRVFGVSNGAVWHGPCAQTLMAPAALGRHDRDVPCLWTAASPIASPRPHLAIDLSSGMDYAAGAAPVMIPAR
jgi:hypothetical protein